MPHDRDGALLAVDDLVTVECRVKTITMQEDYCNVTLETTCPMPPYTTLSTITINAKQVRKVSPAAVASVEQADIGNSLGVEPVTPPPTNEV